jgi:hypothetical protein
VKSVDPYLSRVYNHATYNCAHLVCDVWEDMTARDIRPALVGLLTGIGKRESILQHLRIFKNVPEPVEPCIVLLQSPRTPPHVGIYLRGRVLHIIPRGVEFQYLEVVRAMFKTVRFYTCR